MNDRSLKSSLRQLQCSSCGTAFSCSLSGDCWCADETAKLPMPTEGGDCLCRDCLRKAAAAGMPGILKTADE
ncbi:MAG TPA: hypothetical protein VJ226_14265 [Bradyrhizobium sp.]|nr:hypothetical protein [Bradyrhizobium sp.]